MAACTLQQGWACSNLFPLLDIGQQPWLSHEVWPNVHRFPALPFLYATASTLLGVPVQSEIPLMAVSLTGYFLYLLALVGICQVWQLSGVSLIGILWAAVHPHLLREAFTGDSTVWDCASIASSIFVISLIGHEPKANVRYLLSFLFGTLAGLAFLFRYTSILWNMPFLLALFLLKPFQYRKGWAQIFCWGAGFVAVVVPWLIHMWITAGSPFFSLTAQIVKYTRPGETYPWFLLSAKVLSFQEYLVKMWINIQSEISGLVQVLGWSASKFTAPFVLVFVIIAARLVLQKRIKLQGANLNVCIAALAGIALLHLILLPLDYVPRYSRIVIPVAGILLAHIRFPRKVFALLGLCLILNLSYWYWMGPKPDLRDYAFHAEELRDTATIALLMENVNPDLILSSQPANMALQFQRKTLPLPARIDDLSELLKTVQRAKSKRILITLFWPLQDWGSYANLKDVIHKEIAQAGWQLLKPMETGKTSANRPFAAMAIQKMR